MPRARIIASSSGGRTPTGMAARYDSLHRVETSAGAAAESPTYISAPEAIALNQLRPYAGDLLDVGCGRGTVAIHAHSGFRYRLGLDFSEFFLEQAVVRANALATHENIRIEFMKHDLDNSLPLAGASFDAVVSLACLEHVFDVYGLLSELRRIMKPGAVLVLQVPNIAYARHRLSLLLGRLPVTASSPELWWRDYWDGTHLHYFTLASVKMLLAHVGLVYVGVTGSGRLRPLRAWRPSLLTGDLIVIASKPHPEAAGDDLNSRGATAETPCEECRDPR